MEGMKGNELRHLCGADCTVWVNVGREQPFHYTGKVVDVTDSLLVLVDKKTGQRMNFAFAVIVSITELGGRQ